jgi:succinate dehydrogenase / fumarate reductase flavoprotein subunit
MCREAIEAVYDLEHMGMPFNRTPDGKIDQRRFGGHTHHHGKGAVRRSCFAADRTGHMILQTLYQQNVKQGTVFFDEFYVLDLLLSEGRAAGVVAYELATGELHVFRAKAVVFCTGGLRQDVQDHLQRPRPHRRRPRGLLPARRAHGGHGVLPVPPHRPLPASGCC